MILHKYNGCGNDFILLDYAEDTDYSQLAASLCTKEKYDTDGLIAVKIDPLSQNHYCRQQVGYFRFRQEGGRFDHHFLLQRRYGSAR